MCTLITVGCLFPLQMTADCSLDRKDGYQNASRGAAIEGCINILSIVHTDVCPKQGGPSAAYVQIDALWSHWYNCI